MTTQNDVTLPRRRHSPVVDLSLVAVGAALLCVLGPWSLPALVGPVPITLQTLAVTLVGLLLGPVRGPLAVLLYLAIGATGLPVFAELSGGLSVLVGYTSGYLWSFPIAAAVAGIGATLTLRRTRPRWHVPLLIVTALVSAAVVFPLGITVLKVAFDLSWPAAVAAGLTPFVIGGVAKAVVAALVAASVHRAFPQLLRR